MKKLFFLFSFILFLGISTAQAQATISVKMTNGTVTKIALDELASIKFDTDAGTTTLRKKNDEVIVVDTDNLLGVVFDDTSSIATTDATPGNTTFAVVDGNVRICSTDGIKHVSAYSASGVLLYSSAVKDCATVANLPLARLGKGICVIKVATTKANITQKTVIK